MQVSGMEQFNKAKTVRLKSHHDKYLTADSDRETVVQVRSGIGVAARWTVEFVEGVESVVRLKSCYGKYLTASDEEFLKLGVSGQKVIQSLPKKLDSSVEWEPVKDGNLVKLKTRYGNFLRANGGLPPWRNSITHDIPHRHRDWVLWEVHVVEVRSESPNSRSDSLDNDLNSDFHITVPSHWSGDSHDDSQRKSEGRLIYYRIADDDGGVENPEQSFHFKGNGVEELTQKLEEETGLDDIIVCSRNIVNAKLYPLRLALPPNNTTMRVVLVPPTARAACGL
ncbi:uncharacterized protein LOC127242186 [Andrographis paniculata]|uniref:uncharacterized protein LOC127242186 n=1 Tax=Andrographis paniculata TaxID=175694 RepID=UPI0021E6FBA2|nr:uncharacterized protein LOC127242186 [Andrographis paniculata]